MLISHSHKFIYLKTTKTAGTSVEVALQKYAIPDGMDATKQDFAEPLETEAGIVGARGKGASSKEWFHHMPAHQIKDKVTPECWNHYFKFCNIRNPWDKTVSAFHFLNPESKEMTRWDVFESFRAWLARKQKIMRDTNIYFIEGKLVADDVIRYETLEADLKRVSNRLAIPKPDLPKIKSEWRGPVKLPYQDYYDETSKATVAEIYALEISHFGWTFD